METVYARCAGLDVHKEFVQVCVRMLEGGGRVRQEVRRFSTLTRELLALGDWLESERVTHVAMESTGVLWKPVFNVLEERFTVWVCNAQHLKQVPGRKTDVKDCQWIAQLLQCGLLRPSFVPERPLRELRDLTRQRAQVIGEMTRVKNRIHKTLEDANIKLSCVATDILGASGRAMLEAILAGETQGSALASLARGRLRAKRERLEDALQGRLREHHRFMLETLYLHLKSLESLVARLEARIDAVTRDDAMNAPMSPEHREGPFESCVTLLDSIPGVNRTMAQTVLAEIGTDMRQFPTPAHLASWAGLCPGSNESAGKRKSGRTTKGCRWLRRAITQAAWAATRQKGTYLQSFYRRLAKRRGKKRAIVAVAHMLLVSIHCMLSTGMLYEDLGPNHFEQQNTERLTKHLIKRLEALGHVVEIHRAA